MNAALPPKLTLESKPHWKSLYQKTWELAKINVATPDKPGWKPHMTCMPGFDYVWGWDSCFMTLFSRYGNKFVPTMECLDNLYRLQREDGFIGMAYRISTDQLVYGERVNPPLFSWAEISYWRLIGDDSRLATVLPVLVRQFDWMKANRRRNSGLYWFEDAASSGMDNSPRSGYEARHLCGSDVCYVDFAAQQALSAECLALMARHIGDEATALRMEQEYTDLKKLINQYHWDEKSGFYYDLFARSKPEERHNFVNHKTVAGFWPLLAGICSTEQCERLVEHLLDPELFWTSHPVASLTKDDPNYDPKGGYWLGGVWAPTNYMIAKALHRYGRYDVAHKLATAHIDAMAEILAGSTNPGVWECYAPEGLRPGTNGFDRLARPNFVGWSGLGPVAMLIEDVFGLDFDASKNEITWRLSEDEVGDYQVDDVPFNGGQFSFGYVDGDDAVLQINATQSFTLNVWREGELVTSVEVPVGSSQVLLKGELVGS